MTRMSLQLLYGVTGMLMVLTAIAGSAVAGGQPPVPEIDPGMMASALALLSGGLFLLTRRPARG